ncbi:hypothetical protein ONS95_007097 [Cadophora gregata]|uniref:uncharacterized protein n=1 Tax=Cadophora gregata TaxID=51156 RepID=UPI0026DCB160|nr:uncharacterized protein ONS95_007097 [Cadophora gregata]KAK0100644.1 hypothetical protein ONS95_007097 [Cadophora gregata]
MPFELRLMVWKLSLPGPRTITILEKSKKTYRINSAAISTPLLHVCHELRELALKRYTAAFESDHHEPFYFDFESDSLNFPTLASMSYFRAWKEMTALGSVPQALGQRVSLGRLRYLKFSYYNAKSPWNTIPLLIYRGMYSLTNVFIQKSSTTQTRGRGASTERKAWVEADIKWAVSAMRKGQSSVSHLQSVNVTFLSGPEMAAKIRVETLE